MSEFMQANPQDGKSNQKAPTDETVLVRYERTGAEVRFKTQNITNHELTEVVIGIVARMEEEDREDFYGALVEYAQLLRNPQQYHDRYLSPIAAAIAQRPDLLKKNRG
jgi:hypothetical protein